MMSKLPDWRSVFPLLHPRPEQEQALDYIIDQFYNQDVNYVVTELGTGVGKSAIAVTLARWLAQNASCLKSADIIYDDAPKTYVLTSQKLLQDQYVRDFPSHARDLRSSSNYSCGWMPNQTCAETLRIERAFAGRKCLNNINCANSLGGCPYKIGKKAFRDHWLGVTNYSYFINEATYVNSLGQRELIVFDESHNVEAEIRSWATISFNEEFAKRELKLSFPSSRNDDGFKKWVEERYAPALSRLISTTLLNIEKHVATSKFDSKLQALTRKYELLDKHICQVNRFVQEIAGDRNNYLVIWGDEKGKKTIQLKPLNITWQARSVLYSGGRKRLFMSATILDMKTFSRTIGIPEDEKVGFINIPSPFPTKNRPIYFLPSGNMAKAKIDQSLPNIVNSIKNILDIHKEDRGLIHCHTYKIAKYIDDNVKNSRLLLHDSGSRESTLKQHCDGILPTVLLSPSMTEGVDLAEDKSRFQVICKIPYPYIGDDVVAAKMKEDPDWYNWITARTIIQAIGRSVRSSTDQAVTYILDDGWKFFYQKNRKFFPRDFDILLQK